MYTHKPAPRSITPDMIATSGSADPLNVNFTITHVSTVNLPNLDNRTLLHRAEKKKLSDIGREVSTL